MANKRVIHKYPLRSPLTFVRVPAGAQLLSVQAQGADICLWFLVDPAEARVNRRYFLSVNTGDEFDSEHYEGQFIATVQIGQIVWHIFERDVPVLEDIIYEAESLEA